MVQPSAVQRAQILQAGWEIAFDQVWAMDPDDPAALCLVVRVGPGRTVSARTVPWFHEAVERIVPGTNVEVKDLEALDGLGDPAARETLLHMVELTGRLTDGDAGLWQVTTASGSIYLLDLAAGRSAMTRLPARTYPLGDYARIPVADLRRDGETVPLLSIGQLQLGQPGALLIDVRGDGVATVRNTTPVISIERLAGG